MPSRRGVDGLGGPPKTPFFFPTKGLIGWTCLGCFMAKRSFSNSTGVVLNELASGTFTNLAGDTAFKIPNGIGATLDKRFKMLKMDVFPSLRGFETDLDDGPLELFLTSNSLSTTELQALLAVDGPIGPYDDVAMRLTQGIVNRIIPICQFGPDAQGHSIPNNGMPIEVKPNWSFEKGTGWSFILYNDNGSTMNIEGKNIKVRSRIYGVWVN